jgi:hypothetical protein
MHSYSRSQPRVSGPQVRHALITAAGAGAGNFPASKAVKPEMFPIIDIDGRAKPVVLVHVESLLAAGITDIHIVVQVRLSPTVELHLFGSQLPHAFFAGVRCCAPSMRVPLLRAHSYTQPEDLPAFERLFKKPVTAAHLARLPTALQEYERNLMDLSTHVHFIVQERQEVCALCVCVCVCVCI